MHLPIQDIAEWAMNDPLYFRNGGNLKEEEKAIIDIRDFWLVSLVSLIYREDRKKIGEAFNAIDFAKYMDEQKQKWFKQEAELLEKALERKPTSLEIIADAEKHDNMGRYRLCYILKHPRKVKFEKEGYSRYREEADLFLAAAELIHEDNYPYFEKIWCNTLLDNFDAKKPIQITPKIEQARAA